MQTRTRVMYNCLLGIRYWAIHDLCFRLIRVFVETKEK